MKSSKHILILTPGFPADENDTTCIPTIQAYLRAFLKADSSIIFTVISLQYPYSTTEYHWNNIKVIPMGGMNKRFPSKLLTWNKVIRAVKRLNNQRTIDLVHAFWMNECALLGQRIAQRYDIPHVITLMGQDAKASNAYLKLINYSKAKTIALSDFHANVFKENTKHSVSHVVPFGIDISMFPTTINQTKNIDIIGVGSLNDIKDYNSFVEIIREVKKLKGDVEVEIIGGGEKREEIESKINAFGLTENITCIGQLPHGEVLEKMGKAKILLHTSNYESMGYVFLEALKMNCRIVSRNVGLAKSSPHWKIAKNQSEFINHLKTLLADTNDSIENASIPSITDTMMKYQEIYDEKG